MCYNKLLFVSLYPKKKERKKDNISPPNIIINQTGKFKCYYKIDDTSHSTQLVNEDYNNNMITDMLINDTKAKYNKNYKFISKGIYKIQFYIYGNIALNYMFKNIIYPFWCYSFQFNFNCNIHLFIN